MESIKKLSNKMKKEFMFFNSLPEDELLDFLSFCENRQVPAGETLWCEGDEDNYAAFIISGQLDIKKKTEFEGKYMIVGTFSKGSVVGELCLLSDDLRSVTVEVIETADLVILTSKNFERLLTKHPMLGLKFLKNIFIITTKRLNRSYDRIASLF
jgi:CRP-like cAMP-binding protein